MGQPWVRLIKYSSHEMFAAWAALAFASCRSNSADAFSSLATWAGSGCMALDDAHPMAHRRAARFRRSVPTRRVVISSAKLARRAWIQTARNGSFRFNGVILVHRGHVCGRSIPPSPRDSMRDSIDWPQRDVPV